MTWFSYASLWKKTITIIRSKQTNAEISKVWKEITDSVNARAGGQKRSVYQIKEKWRKACFKAKVEAAVNRKSLNQTGWVPSVGGQVIYCPVISHTSLTALETLEIWYPIVPPITLFKLPHVRYLRASFTYMSTGMTWDLRGGLHNFGSIRLAMNWRKSIPEFSFIKIQLNMPIHSFFFAVVLPYLPMVKYLSDQNWGVNFIHWIIRFNQWITLTNVLSNPVQISEFMRYRQSI